MFEMLYKFIEANFRALFKILGFPGVTFIMVFIIFAVWYQRKYLARLMLRMGPVHAGKVLGWLQLIADALKLLTKEIILPRESMKKLFLLSAILLSVIPAAGIALIPFARGFSILPIRGFTLPLFLAIMTLYPIFIILMGWSANNKFTIIGAFRSIYLDVAGEIPLILSAIGVMIWAGTYDIQSIIELQKNMWFVFPQILGFITFLISYLAMIEKVPFDIPEAESELVFGYKTEYTGALFLDTMLGDYVNLLAWALIMISLYFGGYLGPSITGNTIIDGSIWMLIKLIIIITITFTIMISYARLRIDQAVRVGWNYLIPLSILNIILTIVIKYLVLGGV